ncbi:hypothetical protein EDD11_003354 [Mortierella claussenii]|nr:hypothetical protein EDD11_003354 [Mortierella claussenii]
MATLDIPQAPTTPPSAPTGDKPHVLIIGAGLGGLILATLFERSNIPYQIIERATQPRPLGSALTLGANILPVFDQLGLLRQLEEIALPCSAVDVYKADMKKFGSLKLMGRRGTGYENLIFERPRLYDLLLKQIPTSKLHLGKKVTSTEEIDSTVNSIPTKRVMVHCADNSTFEGDILVGADGAYSTVRSQLLTKLDEQGLAPKEDLEDMLVGDICMVGVANVAEEEVDAKFPQLRDGFSHFSSVIGENKQCWIMVSVPNNRICWSLITQLTEEEAKEQKFKNSEWSPESNDAMIKEFAAKACPWGTGTMGDIVARTPRDLISKVFLEEKLFKTWYSGRTVLIGDGQGAVNAMQDAVVLANCIYHMESSSSESITAAFEEYYRQRFDHASQKFQTSKAWSMIMFGQKWTERLLRQVMLNYTPDWVFNYMHAKAFEHRPQISWLPLVEKRGTLPVLPQESGVPRKSSSKGKKVAGKA